MSSPKNVQKNNLMRAYLLDCNKLELIANPNAPDKGAETIFGWIFQDHGEKLRQFVKSHQNTCAVHELVLTTIWIEVLCFCVFTCPRCRHTLKVEVGG